MHQRLLYVNSAAFKILAAAKECSSRYPKPDSYLSLFSAHEVDVHQATIVLYYTELCFFLLPSLNFNLIRDKK